MDAPNGNPLGIIIPGQTVEYRCLCGKEFFSKSTGMRHAIDCTDAMDDAMEQFESRQGDLIGSHDVSDPEAFKWGRDRIAEGKVGFKRGRPA